MTKDKTTFRPKDNYFRVSTKDLTEFTSEVKAAPVDLDGVR